MALADRFNNLARRVPVGAVYAAGAVPALWLVWLALNGGLGVDPVKALERQLGKIALQLLIAGLAVTPLRILCGVSLLRFRRALGVLAFSYVVLHLLVWLVLDVQIPSQIWADIVKRPYITIGMTGFALLVPLALTSNDWSVRRLGRRWRRLHRLVYVAVPLGGLHYVMLVKGFQIQPLVYLAIVTVLLLLRLPVTRRRSAQVRP